MKFLALALSSIFLSGCTQTTIEPTLPSFGIIVVGQDSFFNGGQTFSWHKKSGKAFIGDDELERKILSTYQKAIEAELTSKGYHFVDDQSSGMKVAFGIARESELSDQTLFSRTQLDTGINSYGVDNKKADEKGTIYIAFFRGQSNTPQWKVLAQGGYDPDSNHADIESRSTKLMTMLLNRVPKRH
ncbi:DUF4136 domain-containing protein [Vibrio tapetis]|uniref:DUF4136 domain-containing protein n=1 Tax=Vibrio tapetis subsp. tapetis TaxID=1671868 RepID=A0A2N8ZM25_9VIBR|nr:DUF4136 domain-containing protein [Vibrio tapetis]SON52968.1 conserved exported protein of unknown function [Vibrio tapetis subsp. tapetis]